MDNFDHNENTLSGKGSNHDTTLIFQVGFGLSETKVKLAESSPNSASRKPY